MAQCSAPHHSSAQHSAAQHLLDEGVAGEVGSARAGGMAGGSQASHWLALVADPQLAGQPLPAVCVVCAGLVGLAGEGEAPAPHRVACEVGGARHVGYLAGAVGASWLLAALGVGVAKKMRDALPTSIGIVDGQGRGRGCVAGQVDAPAWAGGGRTEAGSCCECQDWPLGGTCACLQQRRSQSHCIGVPRANTLPTDGPPAIATLHPSCATEPFRCGARCSGSRAAEPRSETFQLPHCLLPPCQLPLAAPLCPSYWGLGKHLNQMGSQLSPVPHSNCGTPAGTKGVSVQAVIGSDWQGLCRMLHSRKREGKVYGRCGGWMTEQSHGRLTAARRFRGSPPCNTSQPATACHKVPQIKPG